MAFEGILSEQGVKPTRWRRWTLVVSLALHAGALFAAIAHSLWQVEEMPLPAVHVTLTAELPPPPPPPPPARRSSSATKARTKAPELKPDVLVQPKEVPKEQLPAEEESAEPGAEDAKPGGQEGGVEGGVQGGVVGGVVGSPAPPPPPQNTGPKLVSAQIARGQLLINPNVDPYRVKLPPALARGNMSFFAVLRVCVSAQGAVTGVSILRSAGPAIDPQIPSVLGRWRYRPLLMDGRPTPFCYLLRYEISAR